LTFGMCLLRNGRTTMLCNDNDDGLKTDPLVTDDACATFHDMFNELPRNC